MTDEPVNTGENRRNRGQFVKGDKRINRHGRPTKDQVGERKIWQDTFAEYIPDGKGGFVIDEMTGKPITRLKARIRIATGSRNSHEFELALKRAYGEIKHELDLSNSDGSLSVIRVIEHKED